MTAKLHISYWGQVTMGATQREKPDASMLRIWGCKAWKLIPRDLRTKTYNPRKSEEVRFVGFDWPSRKAYRVLTRRVAIDTARHLAFDETAPPACDSRADFAPHLQTEIYLPQPVVPPSTRSTAPAVAPLAATSSETSTPAPPVPVNADMELSPLNAEEIATQHGSFSTQPQCQSQSPV
jgi:hypothetical protein